MLLQWFVPRSVDGSTEAGRLRTAYEEGALQVVVPSLALLEIVNVAARRWKWDGTALIALASDLTEIGFELAEPPLESVAKWAGIGMTAYDAAFVALAEYRNVPLVTEDRSLMAIAPEIARPEL